ncbi:MAG: hypothetical protein DRR03_07735 [Gammaproteobacteria bacterium]|nr:MAG: hypothetical protein DRR03_07735 [Gammaproteobacteria bacterium]
MRPYTKLLAGAGLALALPVAAQAQQAAGVPVGNMQFYPKVTVGVGHDDNVSLLPAFEIDSDFVQVKPSLILIGEGDKTRAEVGYEGDWAWYDINRFDYDDHRLFGIGDLHTSDRLLLNGELEYRKDHDDPGSTDRARNLTPDEWRAYKIAGKVRYGAESAKGRLEGALSYIDKEYTNHRADTIDDDKDNTLARGTFFWRVGGRTDALAELIYEDIDYKLDTSLQDSRLKTANLGVEWEATGKTTGKARFGYTKKDFRSSLVPDSDIFSWDISATWNPRIYSAVDLKTRRTIEDSTGQGSSIDSTNLGAAWRHAWRERFSTTLGIDFQNGDYNSSPREDDTVIFALRGDYQFRRWLGIGLSYRYRDNDSNEDINDYKQNVFLLEATGTL